MSNRSPSPSIGRIVHYYPLGHRGPIAAVVTRVLGGGDVNLRALFDDYPDADEWIVQVPYARQASGHGFCWTWPPRVP